jgi:uncharacterized membrane protein
MSTHEHTIVVDRPVRVVYDQWTQFESYPDFMENVERVEQLGDTITHWKVRVGGVEREYDAAITEKRPDEVIAWQTVEGPDQSGMVSFVPVDPDRTRVTLQMDFEPEGLVENIGDAVGAVSSSIEHSLLRFKDFIEQRDSRTPGEGGLGGRGAPMGGGDLTAGDISGDPTGDATSGSTTIGDATIGDATNGGGQRWTP